MIALRISSHLFTTRCLLVPLTVTLYDILFIISCFFFRL